MRLSIAMVALLVSLDSLATNEPIALFETSSFANEVASNQHRVRWNGENKNHSATKEASTASLVRVNPKLKKASLKQSIRVFLPNGFTGHYRIYRKYQTKYGNTVVAARGSSSSERIVIAMSPTGMASGMIKGGGNTYSLEATGGNSVLKLDEGFGKEIDDVVYPDRSSTLRSDEESEGLSLADPENTNVVEINVLVYYDTLHNNPMLAVDTSFAIANQAYIDSGIHIVLNPVQLEPLELSPEEPEFVTISQMYSRSGAFSDLDEIMDLSGADIATTFIAGGGRYVCGIARLSLYDDSTHPNEAINVTSCQYGETFAHEIGHNLGAIHDIQQSPYGGGVFPYARGFRNDGLFGTVMSYGYPEVGLFSSPELLCATDDDDLEYSCGIPIGEEGEADVVTAHNQVRFIVSEYRGESSFVATGNQCSQYSITLDSQSQIDEFQSIFSTNGSCSEIAGDLTISGEDIKNLDGLSDLTNVRGGLYIHGNKNLEVLRGLDSIETVGRYIGIVNNSLLSSLDGLSSITQVGGFFNISNNPALQTIAGLLNLSSVTGTISVNGNDGLSDLSGFSEMSHIGGGLTITSSQLSNLNGLESVETIGGDLKIASNSKIEDLSGLSNLSSIGRSLDIRDNALLSNLEALERLTSIGHRLYLYDNPSLLNLSGLDKLTQIPSNLDIDGNENLSDISALANIEDIGETLYIWNNPALTSLQGLENISNVGRLSINNNSVLTNLNNMESLSTVGAISIFNNAALTDLNVFANISSLSSYLYVGYNESLIDLSGLANIEYIGGHFMLYGFKGAAPLEEWKLTSVGGNLRLNNNTSVENLLWLGKLDFVGGSAQFSSLSSADTQLKSLDGMDKLSEVLGDFTLTGFSNLSDCTAISLLIGWKEGEPFDHVGGEIRIENNGSGCNSNEEIIDSAPFSGRDKGQFFAAHCKSIDEANTTGLLSNEKGLANINVDQWVEVICPVITTEKRQKPMLALTITLAAQNIGSEPREMQCSLKELSAQIFFNSINRQINIADSESSTFKWIHRRPSSDLSNYSVQCSLPPETTITSFEIQTVY